jgi:uncharacterized phage infection (PIP) family protein YhgE
MVQKPPVDIEWYDDGFSMEEQAELKKQYNKQKAANRPKIKVTEEYHERTKDKIISDLRQKLAANEEYIKELEDRKVDSKLEEQIEQLTKEKEEFKKAYTTMNAKYAALLNDPELGVHKYRDTIKDLEKQVKELKKIRDELIGKLCSQ